MVEEVLDLDTDILDPGMDNLDLDKDSQGLLVEMVVALEPDGESGPGPEGR